ncbi:MAG: hypothetical protein KF788_13210 [Piscinibacter sp.]|nr:hypothetical protein [Piscinibacter sp.]
MSTEAALALLVVALYLKDCLLLLRSDEALMVTGVLGRRWHAAFGRRDFTLAGREPWLANPFLPHVPVYRLRWSMRASVAATSPAPLGLRAEPLLWRLAPLVWGLWALLFVAVPLAVLGRFGVVAVLWLVGLVYAHIVVALALAWRWRVHFGLSGRAFALLSFECLVCAPYAANLVRRLSLAQTPREDFTAAAARLLPPEALAKVHRECLARIDQQLEAEPEDSAAAAQLQAARRRFDSAPAADDVAS